MIASVGTVQPLLQRKGPVQKSKVLVGRDRGQVQGSSLLYAPTRPKPQDKFQAGSIKDQIMDFAKGRLKKEEELTELYSRLVSNKFTVSRKNFNENIDLSITSTDEKLGELKAWMTKSNLIDAMSVVSQQYRDVLASHMLRVFAVTGNMPALVDYDQGKGIVELLQSKIAKTENLQNGFLGFEVLQNIESFDLLNQKQVRNRSHTLSSKNCESLMFKDPSSYNVSPHEKVPMLDELQEKLETHFNRPENQVILRNLYKNIDKLVTDQKQMQELLGLLHGSTCNSLQTPHVPFFVRENSLRQSEDSLGLDDRSGFNKNRNSITLYLSSFVSSSDLQLLCDDYVKRKLFTSIVHFLIEESVHAWQYENSCNELKLVTKIDADRLRLEDYRENFRNYNTAQLSLALTGNMTFYSDQPVEKDAKQVTDKVVKTICKNTFESRQLRVAS